jgi:pantetheine-phosphate adenylyltransferase
MGYRRANIPQNERTMMSTSTQIQERVVTIGGTFDAMHLGHQEYIRLAFEFGDHVIIYVNSDEYAQGSKEYQITCYEQRVKGLKNFIDRMGLYKSYQIRCLHKQDELKADYLKDPDLAKKQVLAIVSPEYYSNFLELNRLREAQCLNSFLIMVKPRTRSRPHDILSTTPLHYIQDDFHDLIPIKA